MTATIVGARVVTAARFRPPMASVVICSGIVIGQIIGARRYAVGLTIFPAVGTPVRLAILAPISLTVRLAILVPISLTVCLAILAPIGLTVRLAILTTILASVGAVFLTGCFTGLAGQCCRRCDQSECRRTGCGKETMLGHGFTPLLLMLEAARSPRGEAVCSAVLRQRTAGAFIPQGSSRPPRRR